MPRKLKTYIANLTFFELAIAAPSMKATPEGWVHCGVIFAVSFGLTICGAIEFAGRM
jgi:hypothetical protein